MRAALGVLRDEPTAADVVIEQLVSAVEPALVSTAGSRYFGFVDRRASWTPRRRPTS